MNISDAHVKRQFVQELQDELKREGINVQLNIIEVELYRCIPQCANENFNLKEATIRSPVHKQLVDRVLLKQKILHNIRASQSVGNAWVNPRPHESGYVHVSYEERSIIPSKAASEIMYKERSVFRD